jgi:hypothetical protein
VSATNETVHSDFAMSEVIKYLATKLELKPQQTTLTKGKSQILKQSTTSTKRKILVVDPITLKPMVGVASLPTKGYYKKFTANKMPKKIGRKKSKKN